MNTQTPFKHIGWGIRVWNDPAGFEEAVTRAVQEADAYGVDVIDLHDGVIPPDIGWVTLFSEYRHVPVLQKKYQSYTYKGRELSHARRDEYRQWFSDICLRISDAGLKIHAWYHVLDNLPEELLATESTLSRWDGRRLWQTIGGQLDDFFSSLPQVNAITVTGTQVLANSLNAPGGVAPGERLRAIYQCIYEACKRNRREFVIREIGSTAREISAFFDAVTPLPPDIPIMVKDTQDDWRQINTPINPSLHKLRGKRIIVESDLYGEHWGRQDIPMCRLQEIHRSVRSWLPLNVQGATGRIMVRQNEDTEIVHAFDTPNSANLHAFSYLMHNPGPRIEDVEELGADIEAFDLGLWYTWLHKQYGDKASPYIVSALDRTPRIARLVFYLGGAYFQSASHLPEPSTFEREMWPTFLKQYRALGMEVLQWEKEEALRLTRQSLRDIELGRGTLRQEDYTSLTGMFEQARDIIHAYRILLGLCSGRLHPEELPAAVEEATELADRLAGHRGTTFFGNLSTRLSQIAQFILEITRGVPKSAEQEADTGYQYENEDDAMGFEDLGLPMA